MSEAITALGGEHATANKATAWDNCEFIWEMRSRGRSADAIARMLGISAVDVARVPTKPCPSIRRAEPAIVNINSPSEYEGQWVLSLYKGMIRVPRTRARKAMIAAEVAAKHLISVEDLTGTNRARRYAWPRQELMWRLRVAGHSFPQIGLFIGGRDHTTALHGYRAHAKRLAEGVYA